MRVIEQLVQHFWTRGALSREEARYMVDHGFVRAADLAGLLDDPPEPDPPAEHPPNHEDGRDRIEETQAREAEQLEDELVGRNAAGGRKGGKKKPAGHDLAPAAAFLAHHFSLREPYPGLHELGSRLRPCPAWRDAARAVAGAKPADLEAALVGLLNARPRALGELWYWFDLEPVFDWVNSRGPAGPVKDGIAKLLRADVPSRVGRVEQLKKAAEVQALIDLLAARRGFLGMLPVLYDRHFDRLGSWLIPPAGLAAWRWPPLPLAFVILYNARNGTADTPPPGYLLSLPTMVMPPDGVRDALRTAYPMDPAAVRELLLHHLRERQDPVPEEADRDPNMVFDRPLFCPLTWRV